MSVWIILIVAGILLVAALVLIIVVHILDLHAEQQCVQLQDLTQRSSQQNKHKAHYQYRCGESQLCCMCGSVRNRRSQVNDKNICLTNLTPKRSVAGVLQPLVQVACRSPSIKSGSLDHLFRLIRRKRLASGFQGSWFNGWGFFRTVQNSQGKGSGEKSYCSQHVLETPVLGNFDTSTLTAEVVSSTQIGQGLNLGSNIPFMGTIAALRESIDSLRTSMTSPSSNTRENEGASQACPPKRLLLEIIMSPSSREGQGGGLPRATGVRLRVDTNANLDNLADLATSTSSGAKVASKNHGADPESQVSSDWTIFSDGHISSYKFSSGHDGTNRVVTKALGPNMNANNWEECCVPSSTGESSQCTGLSNEGTSLCMPVSKDKKGMTYEDIKSGIDPLGSSELCPNFLDHISGSLQTIPPESSASCSYKPRFNGVASTVHLSAKAKASVGSCNPNSSSLLSTESSGSTNLGTLKGNQSQASSRSSVEASVEGLGSLRISALDAIAKGKATKECSKGVTAQIASALAALNVDPMEEENIGIGPNLASDSSDTLCTSEKGDAGKEEEAIGGSGSELIVEGGDESLCVPQAPEDYEDLSITKKGKPPRKKKNRGRRHKAKAAAVATATIILEAQENVHGRQWARVTTKTTPTQGEVEVGCICGTTKGGCHSAVCPYPFTPSGSMVQRKIKEQYDDLVRSNIARTLTLAQVGRFTTCLVEAKSALQQKSDTIQRRFTIAKSLLSKADKSSFDRLCGQIYGLEIEQKKLEEDTVVYNRLQEQLKLSPAYQKMLEYGRAHFELQPNTGQLIEKVDSEEVEISFEELLAKEKKDSFWRKHGPSRSSMQVS